MNKRIVVPSVIGAVVVGGIAVGTVASATGPTEPTVEDAKARYTAPTSDASEAQGSVTFTAKVSDDSGIRDLKVLAWPKSSDLRPKAGEMADVESATCEESSGETSTCTYTLKVSGKEAAQMEKGTWHVSVLAKAEDGGTLFVPEAASFDVPGPVSSR